MLDGSVMALVVYSTACFSYVEVLHESLIASIRHHFETCGSTLYLMIAVAIADAAIKPRRTEFQPIPPAAHAASGPASRLAAAFDVYKQPKFAAACFAP